MPDDLILFTPELSLDLWYRALDEELGLYWEVDSSQVEYIRNKMHEARRDIADPRLKTLTLHVSKDKRTMMLYHKPQEHLP